MQVFDKGPLTWRSITSTPTAHDELTPHLVHQSIDYTYSDTNFHMEGYDAVVHQHTINLHIVQSETVLLWLQPFICLSSNFGVAVDGQFH